jgi:serine/threonine protein kinase
LRWFCSVFENATGFSFVVIEEMSSSFSSISEILTEAIENAPSATLDVVTVNLAPVAIRLIDILENVHRTGAVVVDMKPENFMLAPKTVSTKIAKKTSSRNYLDTIIMDAASRIRLLDFGMIEVFMMGGHRPNVGTPAVLGTPSYASLHVHDGNTLSRRDDVEASLYIIFELVIQIYSKFEGISMQFTRSNGIDTFLPWNDANSDEELGLKKKENVDCTKSSDSALIQRLPPDTTARDTLWKVLQHVRGYKYNEEPSYNNIRDMFKDGAIPISFQRYSSKGASAKKQKMTTATSDATGKKPSALGVNKAVQSPEMQATVSTSSKTKKASSSKDKALSLRANVVSACRGSPPPKRNSLLTQILLPRTGSERSSVTTKYSIIVSRGKI